MWRLELESSWQATPRPSKGLMPMPSGMRWRILRPNPKRAGPGVGVVAEVVAVATPRPRPNPIRLPPRGTKAAAATKATKSKATKDDSANEPLALVSFVANHGIGSEVDGVVASFTSHGAMVDVEISDGTIFHCYAPKERLGSPPPAKARDVLSRSEQRRFKVVAIDTARRMAELELI